MPSGVLDLDEDLYLAYRAAVIEREKHNSWNNTHELLATLVDTINAFRAEMAVGIPVVMQNKLKAPEAPEPLPRPDWIGKAEDADVIVMRPRDLAKKMMRRRAS